MNIARYRIDPRVSIALIEAERPGYFDRVDRLTRRSLAALALTDAVEALDWYAYRHGPDATIALASTDRRVGVRDEVWRWTDGGPQRALAAHHDLLDAYAAGDVEAVRAMAASPHQNEVEDAVRAVLALALGARDEMTAALLVVLAAQNHHIGIFPALIPSPAQPSMVLAADHFRWVPDSPAGWWRSPVPLRGSRLASELSMLRGRRRVDGRNIDAAIVALVHGTITADLIPRDLGMMFSRDAGLFGYLYSDPAFIADRDLQFSLCGPDSMLHAALGAGHDPMDAISRFLLIETGAWSIGNEFIAGFAGVHRDAWLASTLQLDVEVVTQYDEVFGAVMGIARDRGLDLATVVTLMRDWHGSIGELFAASAALN